MIKEKHKISVQQAILLFLTMVYTPTVRVAGTYTATYANQAAWLCPVVSLPLLFLLLFVIQAFYKNNPNKSFMQITSNIVGDFLSKIIFCFYFIYLSILLALYIRYYAERLVTSLYASTTIDIFMICMVIIIFFIARTVIRVIARMNEVIFLLITIIFFTLIILLFPELEIDNVTPISYLDIYPVAKGSIGIIALWVYIFFLFMMGDRIEAIKEIKRKNVFVGSFLFSTTVIILFFSIGTLGSSVLKRTPLSFYVTVKQISLFNTIQRVESVLISTWILADFIIISMFTFIVLDIIKYLFHLSDVRQMIGIFLIFEYFLCKYLSINSFELQEFSSRIAVPANIIFGLIIPLIIFLIGKIRKKL